MPYINFDENGNITGQFACIQYRSQLFFDIPQDGKTYKIINGELVRDKTVDETKLFTEARECVDKLLTYKLLYPSQAQVYQDAIDARYAKLDADLLLLDGE